jgi:hypothetical protein
MAQGWKAGLIGLVALLASSCGAPLVSSEAEELRARIDLLEGKLAAAEARILEVHGQLTDLEDTVLNQEAPPSD